MNQYLIPCAHEGLNSGREIRKGSGAATQQTTGLTQHARSAFPSIARSLAKMTRRKKGKGG